MQPIADGSESASDEQAALLATPDIRPSLIHVLSPSDHDRFTSAFTAANRGDWTAARALSDQGQDRTAQALVTWRYVLDKDSNASFAEINAFLGEHPDWPLADVVYARAEHAMPATMAPAGVIAWFGSRKPVKPASARCGWAKR